MNERQMNDWFFNAERKSSWFSDEDIRRADSIVAFATDENGLPSDEYRCLWGGDLVPKPRQSNARANVLKKTLSIEVPSLEFDAQDQNSDSDTHSLEQLKKTVERIKGRTCWTFQFIRKHPDISDLLPENQSA